MAQQTERPLNGYFNTEKTICATECLLPLYYKNSDTISVHVIETVTPEGQNVFNHKYYYLLAKKISGVFNILLCPSKNTTLNCPDAKNALTWLWREENPHIKIQQTFEMEPGFTVFLCDLIAQGIVSGMLPMKFEVNELEATRKTWSDVINATIKLLLPNVVIADRFHGRKEINAETEKMD